MYLILLHYKSDLKTVDSFVPEHTRFLQKNYDRGTFLMSGRRIPRTGGVIVARAESVDELWAIIKEERFYINGVSEYEIILFSASMTAPDLESYKEAIPQ